MIVRPLTVSESYTPQTDDGGTPVTDEKGAELKEGQASLSADGQWHHTGVMVADYPKYGELSAAGFVIGEVAVNGAEIQPSLASR